MSLALLLLSPFQKRKDSNKIIYNLEVDFTKKLKSQGYNLKENSEYKILDEKENIERIFTSNDVELLIQDIIKKELQNDIYQIWGYETSINIEKVLYGSLTIIFSVVAAVYYGVSKYKNFIESCELIKKHAIKLLNKKIREKFGEGIFNVSISIEFPTHTIEIIERKSLFNAVNVPILVAILTLGVGIWNQYESNKNKLQSDLILKAFDNKDTTSIASMLRFELNAHLIDDPTGYIRRVADHPSELENLIGINVQPNDLPTMMVGNITQDHGCEAGYGAGCWKTFINANPGDTIAFQIFFHNSEKYLAENLTMNMNPLKSSSDTFHIFVSDIITPSLPIVNGYTMVKTSKPVSISFIPGSIRLYKHGENIGYSFSNEESLFTKNGLLIGNISPGWDTQGALVVNFKVSDL
ncbi:hypothetical protein FRZ67_05370 [Panacibacter ginsenosidivorans]|uniref:Uncharacterized protein n=1 Tax=Panacibacter ginsenosidivorans TaxID=1813871 RepID=A0A5B8V5T2_9BACT|nr:hypothetical protein [Panacibacter ginsenosidivorans]QEC66760.1 hypothetical protein FRZ67_05370 [Panacibacter ginsenosidivorans]